MTDDTPEMIIDNIIKITMTVGMETSLLTTQICYNLITLVAYIQFCT